MSSLSNVAPLLPPPPWEMQRLNRPPVHPPGHLPPPHPTPNEIIRVVDALLELIYGLSTAACPPTCADARTLRRTDGRTRLLTPSDAFVSAVCLEKKIFSPFLSKMPLISLVVLDSKLCTSVANPAVICHFPQPIRRNLIAPTQGGAGG